MKKAGLLFVLFATLLIACQKNDETVSSATLDLSALPQSVTTFISENYPDASITSALKYSDGTFSGYEVVLSTAEVLWIDEKGNLKSDTLVPVCGDSLHSHHGGHHGHGHNNNHGGHGHHIGGIPADSLPDVVIQWINTNLSGFTPIQGHYDTLCNAGTVLEVMVSSSTYQPKKLLFDTIFQYVGSASRITSSDLPESVTSSISAVYPQYTVKKKAEKFDFSDGHIEYRVFLASSTDRKRVFFKEDGTVVCED